MPLNYRDMLFREIRDWAPETVPDSEIDAAIYKTLGKDVDMAWRKQSGHSLNQIYQTARTKVKSILSGM